MIDERYSAAELHWRLFQNSAEAWAEQTAVVDERPHSYGELMDRAQTLSESRRWSDLLHGDIVCIVDSGDAQLVVSLLAAWKRGISVLMVPAWLSKRNRDGVFALLNPAGVWYPGTGVLEVIGPSVVQKSLGRYLPAMLFVTSGTTGKPKIVAHSSTSLLAGLLATIAVVDGGSSLLNADDISDTARIATSLVQSHLGYLFMTCMPLSSIAGFTVLQRALFAGDALVIADGKSPQGILALIASLGVNIVSTVPFIASKLLRAQKVEPVDVSSVVSVGIGGSDVPRTIVELVESSFGCVTIIGYGCTETAGPVVASLASDTLDIRASSVGRPLPNVVCRLGKRVGGLGDFGSGVGELEVCSPSLMLGYWGEHGLVPRTAKWYRTGDLAVLSGDGYVRVLGRISDVIIRGGRNIDPREIESVIDSYPGVERSAVVGTTSRVLGEQEIRAFLEIDSNLQRVDIGGDQRAISGLVRWCMERLPNDMIPRSFEVRKHLPVGADGGLNRLALRRGVF